MEESAAAIFLSLARELLWYETKTPPLDESADSSHHPGGDDFATGKNAYAFSMVFFPTTRLRDLCQIADR